MRKLLLLSLPLACSLAVQAASLTPGQALARLSDGSVAKVSGAAPEPTYTVASADQRPMAYVFNKGTNGGYLVVSADDCAPALLGYTESGAFDIATAPENLRAWLDSYARQIAWAADHQTTLATQADTDVPQRADIAPRLTTNWNQDAPYWDLVPLQSGRHCYTGCVATAMAQVINWHKWPEQPTGSVSYTSRYIGATLKIDFDTVRFEWDKMLDKYTSKSPAENIKAVATLMKACGYAAEMEYSSSFSGALTYKAAAAMAKYFGYDKSIAVQKRDWYGTREWADMVYDELQNGPVYYDGSGEGGGHAFVCDGYRASDGFFHFNWGWGGMSDGYFRLDALYPGSQGAGGVAEGYNWDQAIMRGVKKAQPDSEITVLMAAYGGVSSYYLEHEVQKNLGESMSIKGYETNDGFGNYTIFDVDNLYLGVEIRNTATGAVVYAPEVISSKDPTPVGAKKMAAYTKQNVILFFLPSELAEGEYTIRPVYHAGENTPWLYFKCNPCFTQWINMTVTGTKAEFSRARPTADIEVTIPKMPEFFTSGDPYTIECSITNHGTADFTGTICGTFLTQVDDQIKVAAKGRDLYINVDAGQTIQLSYESSVESGSIEDGDYGFCFGNSTTGAIISKLYPAFVGNRYGSLKLSYFNFIIDNRELVDAGDIHATAEITCPQGIYSGPIALLISKTKRNFKADYIIESEPYQFTAVETKPIEIRGAFQGAELGATYYCVPGYRDADGNYVAIGTNPISMTIGKLSGIDGTTDTPSAITLSPDGTEILVTSQHPVASVSVVNAAGMRIAAPADINGTTASVSLASAPAGVYIVVVATADGNTATAKFCIAR